MSDLPGGWVRAALRDVCLKVDKVEPKELGRSTFRYVDIGSVDGSRHALADVGAVSVDSAPSRARQLVRTGDTVFSTVRPYLEKIAYIDSSLDGEIASTGFCVLRPGPDLLPRYLFHFAASRGLLEQVLPFQKGVSYPAVLNKEVLSATIPVPPIEEQRRIVDTLEDHLSRLDAACRYVDTAASALHGLAESWLRSQPEIGGAPHVPLGELLETPLRHGRSVPTSDVGFPVLRLTAIRNGHVDLRERKTGAWTRSQAEQFLVSGGDFLVSRGNGSLSLVGQGGLVEPDPDEVAFPDTAIRVRVDPGRIAAAFLSLVWQSRQVRRQIEGAARTTAGIHKINQADLRSVVVPVPPLREQDLVVDRAELLRAKHDQVGAALGAASRRSSALRSALLRAAFSGQLVPATGLMREMEAAHV